MGGFGIDWHIRWSLTRVYTLFIGKFARLEYGNCRDLDVPYGPMPMQCYVLKKSQFRGKKTGSFFEKFPSLVLPGITTMVTAPFIQFPLYYLLVVAYGAGG